MPQVTTQRKWNSLFTPKRSQHQFFSIVQPVKSESGQIIHSSLIPHLQPFNYLLLYLINILCCCCCLVISASVTLRTAACQAPLSMGFSRQEYQNGLPCPLPGDLPDPGIKPGLLALQADSLPLSHQGSRLNILYLNINSTLLLTLP